MNYEETLKIPGYWDLYEHSGRQAPYAQGIFAQNITGVVLDSGANPHDSYENRIVLRKNFAGTIEEDIVGHGSKMMGVLGSIHGMMPMAKLLALKVADDKGDSYLHHAAAALNWLVDEYRDAETGEPVDVVSMSISHPSRSKVLDDAIDKCEAKGILVIVSAGNEGDGFVRHPANNQYTIAVAAVDSYLNIENYSSYNQRMMFTMHGTNIMTTDHRTRDGYGPCTGTSPATPMVAGICGLIRSKFKFVHGRRMTNQETREYLAMQSLDLGEVGYDSKYGFGFPTLDPSAPREWTVEIPVGGFYIYNGGLAERIDQPAIIDPDTSRTLVPLRALAEAMDKEVLWNAEKRVAGFRSHRHTPKTVKPLE